MHEAACSLDTLEKDLNKYMKKLIVVKRKRKGRRNLRKQVSFTVNKTTAKKESTNGS